VGTYDGEDSGCVLAAWQHSTCKEDHMYTRCAWGDTSVPYHALHSRSSRLGRKTIRDDHLDTPVSTPTRIWHGQRCSMVDKQGSEEISLTGRAATRWLVGIKRECKRGMRKRIGFQVTTNVPIKFSAADTNANVVHRTITSFSRAVGASPRRLVLVQSADNSSAV
jgi:hypothetical protein